ncbi:oxidoreductase [Streptomyces violarus]|uniref:Aryl-alcohol dehydrogenase-like predicted oxidoreductase n=1 Tax=Streptomyces violarus TaxID=67380 RepID=A0A7W4ZS04_9ACTN|nr:MULTISPECIES: aldo/keto reductase [Streptomyces]MBB3077406.1 aryl-alcohol dehydrogenase-like predicted oxidoreductase [Streptomyces violarus]WRU00968.1 aldo/keto reductase [Streptomyces sp. CGMCC 4.1772]GHD16352.1 oxidoreductase [Streptomyces violarus]
MTVRLGLGTYRCRDVAGAAAMAVRAGADWIDTAPNYAGGQAEQQLALVVPGAPRVKVSTKVGFLTTVTCDRALRAGVVTASEAEDGYCLAPRFIAWQVGRSQRILGREPQTVFLHNPEHGSMSADLKIQRLYEAFGALEQAAQEGRMSAYGIATWSGFSDGLFDVPKLLELAMKAGGRGHHFRAVQLPLSIVNLAPIAQALDGAGVLADAAAAGLDVLASAPLHGGTVREMVTPELAELIRPGSGPSTAGLAVVASAPGVVRVLLSTDNPQHWAQAVAAVEQHPTMSPDRLRKVVDVLGT